jgi:hypothetical protein
VKTSENGRYPKPSVEMRADWLQEVKDAVARVALDDMRIESEIKQALRDGEVYLRQINVDRSQAGQMKVVQAREPVRVGLSQPAG